MSQNVDAICYLTPLQQGMLYHSQREPGSGIYVEQFSCIIAGPLDTKCFEEAWTEVVHRHDALKTLFIRLRELKPMQVVRKQVTVPFAITDWRALDANDQDKRFAELLSADRRQGFDLSKAPLLRLRLIELAAERYRFLWTFHHAVLDGWSLPIVLEEVFRIYAARLAGQAAGLRNPDPYRNYVSWMRAQDNPGAKAFWKDFLKGYAAPLRFVSSTKPRGETVTSERRLATVKGHLSQTWHEAATQVCRKHQITLNTLCQGAWSLLLSNYGNRDDIVYGTVASGRPGAVMGVESMVGLFIWTLPFRTRLPADANSIDWLKQLQATNREIERYGYCALSDILSCSEAPRSLFDILYVFENYPGQAQLGKLTATCGLRVENITSLEETNYSLALVVVPQDGLRFHLTYDTARLSERAAQLLGERYQQILEATLDLEGTSIGDLLSPWRSTADIHAELVSAEEVPALRDAKPSAVEYAAPADELEKILQGIWQELLQHPRIGVNDNYFELGGQSLLATVMLHEIEQRLSASVDIESLLEHPTIAGLAEVIRGGNRSPAAKDLRSEVELDDAIKPVTPFDAGAFQLRNVLLTGATGFLGVHLLADLLNSTAAEVHCLVRAADEDAGIARLIATLKRYRLWEEGYRTRLRAVPGELEQPLLGLDDKQFARLAESIDVIYHNGAQVNFVYPYSQLKQVNVLATRHILELACRYKTKPVHYVSTVGVLDRAQGTIGEELRIPWHPGLVGGYEQSKWVAEQLVCLASERGLPVAIYRPSRIVGHSRTGLANIDDLFYRMLKGIIALGKAPHDAGFDNMVPVDIVSNVIVAASLRPQIHGRAVHVINPTWNSLNAVVDAIEREGFAVERLDYDGWLLALEQHVRKDREHPLAMLIPVLRRLNPTLDPSISKALPIIHANAAALLGDDALGAVARIDALMRVYFEYLYSVGYLCRNQRVSSAQAASARVGPYFEEV